MKSSEHVRVFRSNLGGGWRPTVFGRQASRERMSELTQWERDTLFPKYGLNHGISLVESYGSLKSVHYESLLVMARSYGPPQPGNESRPLPNGSTLRLLGTEYLMLPDTYLPGTKDKLFADKINVKEPPALGGTLWKMKSTFPRAWVVHDVEVLPPLPSRLDLDSLDARSLDVLFPVDSRTKQRTTSNLRKTAVVETDDLIDLAASTDRGNLRLPEQELCKIVASEPTRVKIAVTLTRPGLVVLGDTYAPGWVALLRSADEDQAVQQEVRIHRTNRVFRGVMVPEGRHVLTFEYRPWSFYRGAAVSVLAWIALGLAVVVGIMLRRRNVSRTTS
jgi:hypothetical protein